MTLALVLEVPASEVELASDALWSLGVLAVEERSSGVADHFVELWTSLGEDSDLVTRAADGFPARWQWRLVVVDDSVVDTWRLHVTPSWVAADLVIVPAWIPFDPPARAIAVHIEPGATFGLGNHPTTIASLRAMRASLFDGATVLDVGCGSGVLAITACLLGARRADAIDISPAAAATATENADRNGVGAMVVASSTPIGDIAGDYDVVVANILAPTLIEMAADLRRVLAPAGVLVVSGMLETRYELVVEALAPLQLIDVAVIEGWVALTLRR